jgi:hypothetical protein
MFNLPLPAGAQPEPGPGSPAPVQPAPESPPEETVEGAANDESKSDPAGQAKPPEEKKAERGITDDPYEWGRCAITAHIVWLPGGQVMAGVRSHLDAPIITMLSNSELTTLPGHAAELPLPSLETLADLLAQLREDLPRRAQARAERDEAEHKKAEEARSRRTATSSKTGKAAKKSEPAKSAESVGKPATPKATKAPPPAQVSLFDMLTGGSSH